MQRFGDVANEDGGLVVVYCKSKPYIYYYVNYLKQY